VRNRSIDEANVSGIWYLSKIRCPEYSDLFVVFLSLV
jgi:hypothetical protein